MHRKIAIGTAQFGLDYGVSNAGGKTNAGDVGEILRLAAHSGVEVIDTAHAYGNSEAVLGKSLPANHDFRIVTKTPEVSAPSINQDAVDRVLEAFRASLRNLCCAQVYGLLVHDADDLLKNDSGKLMEALSELRRAGKVVKIGVSVYEGAQIDRILDRFRIDLIQLPVNILDQRLIKSGHLARLAAENIEIHARSAFLQGILLMDEGTWPERFRPYFGLLNRFHESARARNLTPLQAALGFVQGIPEISRVVCGVNNAAQFRQLLEAAEVRLDPSGFSSLGSDEVALVDPRLWGGK